MSQQGWLQQVIEPTVQAVVAPNGSNPGEIPNEDSLDFEFDDTNLFKLNRFAGRDRVDSGTRIDYGLEWTGVLESGGSAGAFIGQSYSFTANHDVFAEGPGREAKLAHLVSRDQARPPRGPHLRYRIPRAARGSGGGRSVRSGGYRWG